MKARFAILSYFMQLFSLPTRWRRRISLNVSSIPLQRKKQKVDHFPDGASNVLGRCQFQCGAGLQAEGMLGTTSAFNSAKQKRTMHVYKHIWIRASCAVRWIPRNLQDWNRWGEERGEPEELDPYRKLAFTSGCASLGQELCNRGGFQTDSINLNTRV